MAYGWSAWMAVAAAPPGKADSSEALLGTNDTKYITPLGLDAVLDVRLPLAAVIKRMTATQASSSTTPANITELFAAMEANAVYEVEAFVTFQSAATTTGLGLGFTSPTGCRPQLEITVPITSTAAASQFRTIFPNATALESGEVLSTGVTAINSNHTAHVRGVIANGANAGNFQLRFRSEVASSAITLQIGSTLILRKIG